MAQKVNIILVDDIDGSDADETVTFALDGVNYEIDLTAGNAEKLREALAPYVGHARRVSGRRTTGRRSGGAAASGPSPSDIRDWARSNGYEVSERGRVSAEIRQAYDAAH
ncbi:histone-like nucleoid-structuring protein Lsr2 [Nocardioides alcanivorans]|uniref:histone-like nucleoid-structuring protein Lsr2 n=1 Tax=Nocardioides alcanivorans TaxID=2897352 RepID=UPI001F33D572|nr:Lsr2 family protein [Nocardioides alcanivorans]